MYEQERQTETERGKKRERKIEMRDTLRQRDRETERGGQRVREKERD